MSRHFSASSLFLSLLTLLLIAAAPALGQQPSSAREETLTLEQAIAQALRDNRQVKIKELAVNKAEDQLAATRTLRLPVFNLYTLGSQQLTQINFNFEQGVFGTFPEIGPIPDKDTSISSPRKPTALIIGQITEPLSQHYKIGLNINLQKLNADIAREQLRAEQHSTINSVKQAYYAVLQTESALRTAEENIKLYRELDRMTEDYVAQRVALKGESLDVKTRLAKAEYDALTMVDQLATQKEQLNILLGRSIHTEFKTTPMVETVGFEADLMAARTRALEMRPEIKEARLKLRQAEVDQRVKKSEFIPDVNMSFNYISPVNFGSIIPKTIASVGISFSWEIFDWGKKRRELDDKKRTVEQAKASLAEAESQVLLDVNSKHRKLQQTRLLLRIAQLTQETARENLRVATNRYSLKAALLSDVLEVQTALAQANQQQQQALASFWTAKAEFEKAIGEDK